MSDALLDQLILKYSSPPRSEQSTGNNARLGLKDNSSSRSHSSRHREGSQTKTRGPRVKVRAQLRVSVANAHIKDLMD
jgi:hypothetical protein